ncbi:hypothetical protein RW64_16570 [Geobacter sulfurreducens]|nr:hypothetical protein RW64_16570 [Geobacter sulfurreducens]
MKRIALCAALLLALTSNAHAALITAGSITASAGGGLYATDGWADGSTVLSWTIDRTGSTYTYDYIFTVPKKEISHVILQVSESFTAANLLPGTTAGWALDYYSATAQGSSNPGMPASIKGLKWNTAGISTAWRIVTDRAPTDGNFYAKDGKDKSIDVYAYSGTSIGFTSTVPVPDTLSGQGSGENPVPLPPALLLMGSGLAALGAVRSARKQPAT